MSPEKLGIAHVTFVIQILSMVFGHVFLHEDDSDHFATIGAHFVLVLFLIVFQYLASSLGDEITIVFWTFEFVVGMVLKCGLLDAAKFLMRF